MIQQQSRIQNLRYRERTERGRFMKNRNTRIVNAKIKTETFNGRTTETQADEELVTSSTGQREMVGY